MGLYSRAAPAADVAVLGGGIIGLAVAWRARQRGLSVVLVEREQLGGCASPVAAGMLAPVSEVEFGDAGRNALELALCSAELWPAFAEELRELTGVAVGLRRTGTLMVARDADEARELERQLAFRQSLGLRAERMRPSGAREHEPALAPTVRMALALPDDHSVDPRRVVHALRLACERAGVELLEREAAAAPVADARGVRLHGLRTSEGVRHADQVVLAAGAWSDRLEGLPGHARVPVRPVKGQTLRLRDPAGPGLLRGALRCRGAYLVPRDDGRYVLGATVEERGFELDATAGASYELLRAAHELVPGISELQLEELCVGLRPGTPDNVPVLGRGACEGLVWATGHYRNGVLLTPLTAQLLARLLSGEDADPMLRACDPARFAHAAASAPQEATVPA